MKDNKIGYDCKYDFSQSKTKRYRGYQQLVTVRPSTKPMRLS